MPFPPIPSAAARARRSELLFECVGRHRISVPQGSSMERASFTARMRRDGGTGVDDCLGAREQQDGVSVIEVVGRGHASLALAMLVRWVEPEPLAGRPGVQDDCGELAHGTRCVSASTARWGRLLPRGVIHEACSAGRAQPLRPAAVLLFPGVLTDPGSRWLGGARCEWLSGEYAAMHLGRPGPSGTPGRGVRRGSDERVQYCVLVCTSVLLVSDCPEVWSGHAGVWRSA